MAEHTEPQPAAPLLAEVSRETTLGRAAFVGEVAPSRDEVLETHGNGDLRLYERLARDDQVHAVFEARRRAVVQLPWRVEATGNSELDELAARHLREQLATLAFDRITERMLMGLLYGYAVGECMLAVREGRVVLTDIKVRRARRFRFDRDGRLLLVENGQRKVLPPAKFWVFSAGGEDDDDVYGRGLGYWLYWPVWFKRNAWRFWSLWLEKLAAGTVVVKGAPGMTPAEEDKYLEIADAVTFGGKVVIPKSIELGLLESARSSGGDYDVFAAKCDAAIAKVIMSQTMTTDDGASRAQAEVHQDTGDSVTNTDADLVCESFCRQVATWLTEWNFPGASVPRVWRGTEKPEDLASLATRDTAIAGLGFRPTLDYIRETYGTGWEAAPAPAAPSLEQELGPLPVYREPKPTPTPAVDPVAPPEAKDPATALNGAQVTSLVEIIKQVATSQIPRETGIAIIMAAFPIDQAKAEAMMGAVGRGFVPAPEGGAPAPAPAKPAPAPTPPVNLAEVAPESSDADWQRVLGPHVAEIETLLGSAKSLEEVQARLGELYTREPTELTNRIARILFVGHVGGALDADDVIDDEDGDGD